MRKLLREFYADGLLASELKFKGGTAVMLFDGLPRFSTDLDFNLTNKYNQSAVFERIREIASRSGRIIDCADKLFGPVVVLDYGTGERNLKIEVSNRIYDNHYVSLASGNLVVPVMCHSDMATHKMCAMLARRAPRDVFDTWFFLSKGWSLNDFIIKERTGLSVEDFLNASLVSVSKVSPTAMMVEIGELLDDKMKSFVRSGALIEEVNALISDYLSFPLIEKQELTEHSRLLLQNSSLLPVLRKQKIDPSEISSETLFSILQGDKTRLRNRTGGSVDIQLKSEKFVVSKGRGVD